MQYSSTRNKSIAASASQAIIHGLAGDGGLYVDDKLGKIKIELADILSLGYLEMAAVLCKNLLRDFSEEQIKECVHHAYLDTFSRKEVTPLVKVGNHYMLELFHGPTAAFKDIALSILPKLMTTACAIQKDPREIVVLTATSGDTGKAALEGFQDVKHTKIIVFYPKHGVSKIQEHQMVTQEGSNVTVCGIHGDFDDAQSGVKDIFSRQLSTDAYQLSSANSINIGRLIPQVVYYFHAYANLIKKQAIRMGDEINVAVPTGNFGNILAAYYAKLLGLPIHKLICASNRNNVLYEFIKTGNYNRNHCLYQTTSPSMDILVSSNLERLLYYLCGQDTEYIASLMEELKSNGHYQIRPDIHEEIQRLFYPSFSTDKQTKETIKQTFEQYQYLLDPHTAIARRALQEYQTETADHRPAVIVATASPFKFTRTVYEALFGITKEQDEFHLMEQLSQQTRTCIPYHLANLRKKEVLHHSVIESDQMMEFMHHELSGIQGLPR